MPRQHTTRLIAYMLCTILVLPLTGCLSYDFSGRVVKQGNLLPEAAVARLKVGMSKEKVASILGHSLLSPSFNENRWDYAYTWRRGGGSLLIKNLRLYFNQGSLVRIESNLKT